ncbi:ribonuclease P protein component [Flavobacteriaceae bacterium]|nr:ribonuclease P protein component [Flavobacteriaceae bacterium]
MSTQKRIQIKRLKGKTTVDFLFDKGEIVQSKMLLLKLIKKPETGEYRSGVSVPKRLFKRAVDRNHIKRQMRIAIGKLNEQKLFEGCGMLLYKSEKKPLTEDLINEVNTLFESLKKN